MISAQVLLILLSVWIPKAESAPPQVRFDFQVRTAELPLTGSRAAQLAPAVLNPAWTSWVLEQSWEWVPETTTLKVTATLHTREAETCRGVVQQKRINKESQDAVKRLRTFAQSRVNQARAAALQGPNAFRRWSERTQEEFNPGVPSACSASSPGSSDASRAPKLLARAPMKLWGGKPSARAALSVGGVTLNGQFLIDLGAAQSSVSPLFIDFQGVPSDWFADPGRQAVHLPWSYRYGSEGFPADEGRMDHAAVAGTELPVRWFRILESEIAQLPKSPSPCCDGVLGLDALRSYPVELRMDEPYELLIWDREGFHPGQSYLPIEVQELPGGVLQSRECFLQDPSQPSQRKFSGVRFMTSLSGSLEFSAPFAASARSATQASGEWKLQCPSLELAQWSKRERADWSAARPPTQWGRGAVRFPEMSARPAVSLGTATLLRGRVIVDLPHGKLWFEKSALELPPASGDWGGELNYRIVDGERTLWIKPAKSLSRFWVLESLGVEPPAGRWVRIHKLNGRDPGGWDLSAMERVMRGLGQGAGAGLDQGKLEIVWSGGGPSKLESSSQSVSRWKARSSSQR